MADLNVRYAMGADPELRPRVVAAVIALALKVISETPVVTSDAVPVAERSALSVRRSYALNVTADVPTYAVRAQFAIACWDNSTLADLYAEGGAAAITDDQITATLSAVWAATGAG